MAVGTLEWCLDRLNRYHTSGEYELKHDGERWWYSPFVGVNQEGFETILSIELSYDWRTKVQSVIIKG